MSVGPPPLAADTVCGVFGIAVRRYGGRPALRAANSTQAISWTAYGERVRAIAAGFAALGVQRGEPVALLLTNRPEFHLVDAALMHLGAVPFSIYNTSAPAQVHDLIADAGAQVLVGEVGLVSRLAQARRLLKHVVAVDGSGPVAEGTTSLAAIEDGGDPAFDLREAAAAVRPEDLLTVIYTSGTTGPPKGVEITHANMLAEIRAVEEAVPGVEGGRVISWLPAAHLAERWASQYSAMAYGREVVCLADSRMLLDVLPVERPVRFGAVPRMWEKLRARIEAEIDARPAPERAAVRQAISAAMELADAAQSGRSVADEVVATARAAEADLFPELRRRVGLDRCRLCTTGAAPTAPELLRFFLAIGIPVCEQWGMTETSCIATLNRPEAMRIGTAGQPLPGVELRLAADGELQVRGPIVMAGYRGRPDLTAEALDTDGWLRTGDIAEIDADGYVTIVDRKKDLIINAAGKNMSPANIEAQLKQASPLIGQACCVGDARPYNVALLVLEPEAAAAFAAARGLDGGDVASLAQSADVRAAVAAGVDAANGRLSRVEQIKRWTLLSAEWPAAGDELTPTMKLRRRAIAEKYATEIEAMYRPAV